MRDVTTTSQRYVIIIIIIIIVIVIVIISYYGPMNSTGITIYIPIRAGPQIDEVTGDSREFLIITAAIKGHIFAMPVSYNDGSYRS